MNLRADPYLIQIMSQPSKADQGSGLDHEEENIYSTLCCYKKYEQTKINPPLFVY